MMRGFEFSDSLRGNFLYLHPGRRRETGHSHPWQSAAPGTQPVLLQAIRKISGHMARFINDPSVTGYSAVTEGFHCILHGESGDGTGMRSRRIKKKTEAEFFSRSRFPALS